MSFALTLPTIEFCEVSNELGAAVALGLIDGDTAGWMAADPLNGIGADETTGICIIWPHLQRDGLPANSLATS